MATENLRTTEVPLTFSKRSLAGEYVPRLFESSFCIGRSELRKLKEIYDLLQNPTLDNLAKQGKLTLGMIKPNAHQGRNLPPTDEEAAEHLLQEIGSENIVFKFSTKLTNTQIELFYSDVKDKYSNIFDHSGKNLWRTIHELLNSGPITFLLIYRHDGNAVDWWRSKMGKTHPQEADINTIRGKYAIEHNLPNNLTHGSDSEDAVKKELSALRRIVHETYEAASKTMAKFPDEEKLKSIGVLKINNRLVSVNRFYDSGMRSESWIYGYEIQFADETRSIKSKFIKEKNIISFGGNPIRVAKKQYDTLLDLQRLGIEVPKMYGVDGASIYSEFIARDQTTNVVSKIKNSISIDTREPLDQLIQIAVKLDQAGYLTLNYLGDLIYDADRTRFLYIDGGFDLGAKQDKPVRRAFRTLLETFRIHREYIETRYNQLTANIRK